MIKFDILNRFSGQVQFTAEIDCDEMASRSLKVGLAAKWAVKNSANLSSADLRNAVLSSADLRNADLWNADLRNADLSDADLRNANLRNADLSSADLRNAVLSSADLRNADLWNADLRNADLSDADLRNANLRNADLWNAYLSDADLWNANLRNADLWNANLRNAHGLNPHVKCIQIETYPITYTSEVMQIGCERHSISEWRDFDDGRIIQMDGKLALKFWRKYKDWIFNTIELCPAAPTKEGVDT